jgi:hypothetical protein
MIVDGRYEREAGVGTEEARPGWGRRATLARFDGTVSDLGYGTNHYLWHLVGTLGCIVRSMRTDAGGAFEPLLQYRVMCYVVIDLTMLHRDLRNSSFIPLRKRILHGRVMY